MVVKVVGGREFGSVGFGCWVLVVGLREVRRCISYRTVAD